MLTGVHSYSGFGFVLETMGNDVMGYKNHGHIEVKNIPPSPKVSTLTSDTTRTEQSMLFLK